MGNVPNLRFPEFCGEWETIKVSELLDFYSTNSLSWEQLDYSNGKIKNLHYGLIHKGVPTMVDVACDSLPYIKEESMLKSFTLFKEGDVAFADASEDTNDVAKAIEVVNCDNQQIVSGLHTIHGRDNSNRTVIGYKGYAFASDSFHKQIRRIAQGTKVFSISVRNFDEAYIGIPSKEEQTQIAKLLITIDKRIATQNKIIEDLKKLKSAITDLLFHSIADAHTIRLGKIAHITNGAGDVQDANTEHQEDWYPFFDRSEELKWFPTYSFDKEAVIYAGEGQSFYPRYYNGKFALHQRCYAITDFASCIIPKYCYHFMNTLNSYFVRNSVGSTVPSLRMDIFQKVEIRLPPIPKQQHICKIIDAFYTKLEVEQRGISILQELKQFLLSQMFI
ncbi:restriction endonuclease subunit S [Bacteroides fluxus]|jgi:type I restriction enzyme S subunit|uniref:Type I restriction modification DNA specificity domain protein n=2 Tax=Bacteroides fluxus TaxID=626930 RepID=F3PUX9_9BACE|nr:restriction endonuclease subunit S [Bacteroides fluxus]EGF55859.1 type I restriction modification DNA specificity domain protein [Bacteroides fluxus YIT 12057]